MRLVIARAHGYTFSLQEKRIATATRQVRCQVSPSGAGFASRLGYRRDFGLRPHDALRATGQCLQTLVNSSLKDSPFKRPSSAFWEDPPPPAAGGIPGVSEAHSRLLVASVDSEFKEAMANGSVPDILGHDVVVLTSDSMQASNDSWHNKRALVDMLALAFFSTELLLTPFSSFGYAVAALSSATPYFLSDGCTGTTREPCYLLPPKRVTCPGTPEPITFSIEYGRMRDQLEPVLEACPDVVWLESYYLRTGRQFECCNHGFTLIQR